MKRLGCVLLLSFTAVVLVFAQQTTDKPLRVGLRSDSSSYSMGGDIQLEIVRENTSNHQLIVPRLWGWGWGRTSIRVFDAQGKEVFTNWLADELPPPPQPWDFVLLDGGEFVGTRLGEPVKHFVNKPGNYEFVVEYTSYLTEKFARQAMKMPDASFWSRERGPIMSNRIRVTVTN